MNGWAASLLIARLTWKRLARGRALWVTLALLSLPTLVAVTQNRANAWVSTYQVVLLLLAIVPPLHLATAVSDEIDDNTFTYLWSRPVPRWSLVTGKIVGLVPALIGVVCAAAAVAFFAAGGEDVGQLVDGMLGIAVGVTATGMLALGIGASSPRYPLAISAAYLLMLDMIIGKLPVAISAISITFHVGVIAQMPLNRAQKAVELDTDPVTSAVWALSIGAIWLGVALWRIRVSEYATKT